MRISAAAPFFDPRQRHPQLAGAERGLGTRDVKRARQPHRARKSSKHALRDVKGAVSLVLAGKWPLLARDHQRIPRDHDLDGIAVDADEIQGDFDPDRRFDDIERNAAFRDMRAGVNASELFK